jgi:hypothetical protein
MLKVASTFALFVMVGCTASSGTDDSCALAAEHVASCTGESPDTTDVQQCDAARAQELLALDCSEVVTTTAAGKADGWWDNVMCGLGYLCRCAPEGSPFSQRTVDDTSTDATQGGPWSVASSGGYNDGSFQKALANHGASASWRPPLAERATFSIRAYIPAIADAGRATYTIQTCGRQVEVPVDQRRSGWVDLGHVELSPGAYVSLSGDDGTFVADAIQFTKL